MKHKWNICVPNTSSVIRFAAEEFTRLLGRMDANAQITVTLCSTAQEPALWIGMGAQFPQPPKVKDPEVDDGIYINVIDCSGYITGTNARSVLLGVYRFFREAGCVFLRPGRQGEYIPQKDSTDLSVTVEEAAAYRHRGICLEGSNRYENVADMIDWAPKLGFNAYFTQLFRPAFAFQRWYNHESNPSLSPTPISNETIDSFVADYTRQVELRGLEHHRIGHGWASKILGYTSGAWHEPNDAKEMIPGREKLIAKIGGKQELFKGSGIDTNLCYSDPEVQELLAEEVVSYAKDNPQTRYLHFWFADQANNQCECDTCCQARPADHYVQILNLIDKRLTEEKLDTKIVFLIYLDLLWEPEKEVFRNPDRFVMMFAPIRRSYSVPMAADKPRKARPYIRNKFILPITAGGCLPYLEKWQEKFSGDSFIFDYHYMWDYINDPGCYNSIKIMAKDVEDFQKLGLGGFMSCQNQRVFMPNGFGMNVIGNTLWRGVDSFCDTAESYFTAAYGKDGEACLQFMQAISQRLDPVVLRGETPVYQEAVAQTSREVPTLAEGFRPVIQKNLKEATGIQRRAWVCMDFYTTLCCKISEVLTAAARGQRKEMEANWQDLRCYVCDYEQDYQQEFDVFEFLNIWENKILYRFRQEEALVFE